MLYVQPYGLLFSLIKFFSFLIKIITLCFSGCIIFQYVALSSLLFTFLFLMLVFPFGCYSADIPLLISLVAPLGKDLSCWA